MILRLCMNMRGLLGEIKNMSKFNRLGFQSGFMILHYKPAISHIN